jgi:hypothetical protein
LHPAGDILPKPFQAEEVLRECKFSQFTLLTKTTAREKCQLQKEIQDKTDEDSLRESNERTAA